LHSHPSLSLPFDAANLACGRCGLQGLRGFWKNNLHPLGRILLPKTLPAAPFRWLFAAYQKAGDRFCRSVNRKII
jgi:hypothetical protein